MLWSAVSIAQLPELRMILDGHTARVEAIAVSGEMLVSGSGDGTAKIWDLRSGAVIRTLGDHEATVRYVAISPDGETIATSADGLLRLWDTDSGSQLMTLARVDEAGAASLAFSPDGRAVASTDGTAVRIWDAASGEELARLSAEGSRCCGSRLAFMPHGRALVSGVFPFLERRSLVSRFLPFFFARPRPQQILGIVLWDLVDEDHRIIEDIGLEREGVLGVAVSPDGGKVATGPGGSGGTTRLWDLASGTTKLLEGHTSRVPNLAFSPSGQLLASASWDGTLRVWGVATGEPWATLEGLPRFYAVAFAHDGQTLIAAGGRVAGDDPFGRILVWTLR